MTPKIFIHAGHGGTDRGATGINNCHERDFNIKIRDRLIEYFIGLDVQIYTHTSDISDKSHSATDVVTYANSICSCDLAIDIHCNAGGGQGFEIWVGKSGLCDSIAIEFCNNMNKINNVRGVKTKQNDNGKDSLYFIRELKAPSLVLESAFVDNEKDYNLLMFNADKIAEVYFKTIVDYYNIKERINDEADVSKKDIMYTVQVGAFRIKENANKQLEQLKALGYTDAFIKIKEDI